MSGNDKSVFAFQKAGGQFVANLICFLCCDFAGSEGLPYLIGDDIAFLAAPGGYSFFVSMNSSSTVSGLH